MLIQRSIVWTVAYLHGIKDPIEKLYERFAETYSPQRRLSGAEAAELIELVQDGGDGEGAGEALSGGCIMAA